MWPSGAQPHSATFAILSLYILLHGGLETACSSVLHRPARVESGSCAPGEEISAIFLVHRQRHFQLPLGLAQRLLFDFFAQHRRISLDSLQILSGLTGDWFYRDHAANSGCRQTRKIRRQAIKVLVQRIREAMEFVFEQARLTCDPWDVLRSRSAVGTKRALYRLHAEVYWSHSK